jgi:hypothetical protein
VQVSVLVFLPIVLFQVGAGEGLFSFIGLGLLRVFSLSSESEKEKRLPPNQKPIKRLLRWGIDHPGITSANPKIDTKTYTLTIDGKVNNPI